MIRPLSEARPRPRAGAPRARRLPIALLLAAKLSAVALADAGRASSSAVGPGEAGWITLLPGQTIERSIQPAERHAYQVSLRPNQHAQVLIEEDNPGLRVSRIDTVSGPAVHFENPWGWTETHRLTLVSERGEPARITLGPATFFDRPVRYRLQLREPRAATEEDLRQRQAERELATAVASFNSPQAADAAEILRQLESVLEVFESTDDRSSQALTLILIGDLQALFGRLTSSVESLRRAASLYRSVGHRTGEAESLGFAALPLRDMGRPNESIEALEQAERLLRDTPGNLAAKASNKSLASTIYSVAGEWDLAWRYRKEALDLATAAGGRRQQAANLRVLAALAFQLGELERSEVLARRTLTIEQDLGDFWGQASSWYIFGQLAQERADARGAAEAFRRSIEMARRCGNWLLEMASTLSLGRLHIDSGKLREARALFETALATARERNDLDLEMRAINYLAELDLTEGRAQRSTEAFERARQMAHAAPNVAYEQAAIVGLARAARARGDLDQAIDWISRSNENRHILRRRIVRPDLRRSYFAKHRRTFELHVELLIQRSLPGDAEKAFEIAERSHARGLLDALIPQPRIPLSQPEEDALRRQEALLLHSIDPLAALTPTREHNAETLSDTLEALREAQAKRRRRVDAEPAIADPRLAEVQAGLEPGTLLLAYFLGSESGYLWALDRNRFSVHRLPPGAAIEASARRLHALLSAGHKTGFAAQATLPARALSDSILQPVAARLAQARRLIIIPDGALHYVPFSILPHPRTGERMLASHPITYTGSAAVLDALRMRGASRQAAAKTLLVVADPAFTPGEARAPPATHPAATHSANVAGASMSTLARAARAFDLADVPPLPFSRREAESILNLIPGPQSHALLGPEATAEAIQQAPLRHYRILHIATHGLLNDRQPELSGLILARSPAGDTLQPTLLRVPEIRRLELRAELVVLSACRTALGREILGEGLVGLPQAFLDAGAQRVLVSLWNVHDQATATLMQRFYEHLLRDEIPAQEALRRAQRTVADMPRWSSPFFWAGFVLIGEP